MPEMGQKAACELCGKEIEYVGPYWRHTTCSPRHIASPRLSCPDSAAALAGSNVIIDNSQGQDGDAGPRDYTHPGKGRPIGQISPDSGPAAPIPVSQAAADLAIRGMIALPAFRQRPGQPPSACLRVWESRDRVVAEIRIDDRLQKCWYKTEITEEQLEAALAVIREAKAARA